jgi:PAS domain S-box-containing protein
LSISSPRGRDRQRFLSLSRTRIWFLAALCVLAALFALDVATGDAAVLIVLYAAAPLIAALGCSLRGTTVVGVATAALALLAAAAFDEPLDDEDLVRLAAVVLVANLAVWTTVLRQRLELEISERRAAARALRAQTDRYETLLRALSEVGEGMVVLEDERAVYVNPAFETLAGYRADDLTAMPSIFDLVIDEQRDTARAQHRADNAGGGAHSEMTIRHHSGHLVDLETAGIPLDVDGHRQIVVVMRDITARKRAQGERERLLVREREARTEAEEATRRADFLAEASAVFDESLDESETLESVARLMVRDFAAACLLVLVEPGNPPRNVSAVARDADLERRLRELESEYAFEELPDHPMAAVMRDGRGLVVSDLQAELRRQPRRDRRHLDVLCRLGLNASFTVPLRARGRTHGVLALGFEELQPQAEAETVALFEDLARRAGLAIDNAALYEERSRVARTLQRSLLPPDLPDVPGVQLAAIYLAAGEGNEVGGDFYDCFSTGGDDWALVIGDVCGKGAEAAAITALARYTVRASVLHSREPVAILSELNEAILRQGLQFQFCTALYASLEPAGDGRMRARLATGGHPLPLVLRAGGTVEVVGQPGTLLGIVPDPDLTAAEVALEPGDALILYTDGVIEASPLDDAFGPERFADFLAGCAGQDADGIAGSIERAVLSVQGGRLRDDVAVVVARPAGEPNA